MKEWIFLTAVLGFSLGVVGNYFYQKSFNLSSLNTPLIQNSESELYKAYNAIGVLENAPGKKVLVDTVFLTEPGFVVIHRNNYNRLGQVLGQSAILPKGESLGVEITLSEKTQEGQFLYAILYKDDGDGVFDILKDVPFVDERKSPILLKFLIGQAEESGYDTKANFQYASE